MVTQKGSNVAVCAVKGNFDDAQNAAKAIFANKELAHELAAKGTVLSSANSINIGRLAPQVTYYFDAYAQLVAKGAIAQGQKNYFLRANRQLWRRPRRLLCKRNGSAC